MALRTKLRWPLALKLATQEALGLGFFAPTKLPKGAKTFAQWQAEGMSIIKGSKAVGRDAHGDAVFSPAQVAKRAPSWPRGHWNDDGDWDDDRYEDAFHESMDPFS